MKMNLAVYTATRGYAWQPNPFYSVEDFERFKKLIGEFPSVRDENFPFGKIFLDGEDIGFCRFHVARRYDFSGRDAFYCVVGCLSRTDAKRIDPIKLFALPEFAQPMKPAPTVVDVDAALRADGGENSNILHLLKTCSVSIDGVKGEGPLSAVFNFDFISLLERYDYSQKGALARNELYQKAGESVSAYGDLRHALSKRLVRFPELHKELFRYLASEESSDFRQTLSQQLLHTPEMHQAILGALDATSEGDVELRRVLSHHLLKQPEMQRSVVEYLEFGPSTWRQEVASRLMASVELRRVLLSYLEVCSPDWRLTVGRKLLEKSELLDEVKQRIVKGRYREELSDILVKTPELLNALYKELPSASDNVISNFCERLSHTKIFKETAFCMIKEDSSLRKKLFEECVQTNEYQEVLKSNWKTLDEQLCLELVLSGWGRTLFYTRLDKCREEVLKRLYRGLEPAEIEDALENLREKKEKERKRQERAQRSWWPWWTDLRRLDKAMISGCVLFIIALVIGTLIYCLPPSDSQRKNHHNENTSLTENGAGGGQGNSNDITNSVMPVKPLKGGDAKDETQMNGAPIETNNVEHLEHSKGRGDADGKTQERETNMKSIKGRRYQK